LRKEIHFDSDLFDWRNNESRSETRVRSLLEKAWEKASNIIENHQVPPLEEKLVKELDCIVAAADKDLLG
jgi:trimethylamine:corrinoid methyltransferase-like protein